MSEQSGQESVLRDDLDSITQEAGQEFGKELKHFAMRVAAAEREACARVCEQVTAAWSEMEYNEGCMDCAEAIRARGGDA